MRSLQKPTLMMNMYKYGTLSLFAILIAESYLHIDILHLSGMIDSVSSFFMGFK